MGIGRPKNKPVNNLIVLLVSIRPVYDSIPSNIMGAIIAAMAVAVPSPGGLCAFSLRVAARYAKDVKIPAYIPVSRAHTGKKTPPAVSDLSGS
jgi:hypothetical protein